MDKEKDFVLNTNNDGLREYVILCNKHQSQFGKSVLLFWGRKRSLEDEERTFSGYTSDINNCELYRKSEILAQHSQIKFFEGKINSIYDLIKYDNVAVPLENIINYEGAKSINILYLV